ncbi:MAG: hypothetical protein Q9176_007314 [Flavoplaca citrina]
MAPVPHLITETAQSHPFDLRSFLSSTISFAPPSSLSQAVQHVKRRIRSHTPQPIARPLESLVRRQQAPPRLIPATYAGLNRGPSAGTVVGIVLGSVAGFLLILWLIYTCVNFNAGRAVGTYEEETVVRRRSRSPRSSRRSPPRRETRRETVIMEERSRPPPPPVEREDDIVEVIEEHSPVRRSSGSRRVSGYRTVDPEAFGGGNRPMRKRAANAAAIIEDEVDHEVTAQRPPSDPRINEATRHGPVTRFAELRERAMVCPTIVKTLVEDMKLETMTQVQSLTINETLKGGDVLAQARTGTGKTLAFLIPVLQNIINYDPKLEQRGYRPKRTSPEDIRAIIISPTRELAEQIGDEARKLTRNTGVIVQTAVGGTQKSAGLRAIKNEGCHILVGTPGRLNDILSDPYSQVRAPNLSAFVLDEADRLLDQGFAPEIDAIQKLLPPRSEVDRQTLLFSATVPREVVQIARRTAKPDVHYLRTVQEGEIQTHERVPQKLAVIRGLENQAPALVELCKREIARKDGLPFKAIVYLNATADVSLIANTLRNLKNPGESIYHKHPLSPAKIIHIHARLEQRERTFAADTFRKAASAIMVSTDVTARGMDFPNVTHIIQLGIPQDRDTYIHRLGRTGRGDKTGEGWLILTDLEADEAFNRLRNLPITEDKSLQAASVDMTQDAQLPEDVAKTLTQTIDASRMIPLDRKFASYNASLGIMRWSPKRYMIQSLNNRAKYCWGMDSPPKISSGLVGKLGLKGVPGVEIGSESRGLSFDGDRGGFSRGGSGGQGGSFVDRADRGSFREQNRGRRGSFQGFSRDREDREDSFGAGSFRRGGDRGGSFRGRGPSSDRTPYDRSDPARRYDRTERSGGFGRSRPPSRTFVDSN